jgi:lysophospholipase L1-like esterase
MSEQRIEWTVAPALGWGALLLCAGLLALDGNLGTLTARLTRTDHDAVQGGPSFLAPAHETAGTDQGDVGDAPDPELPVPEAAAGIGAPTAKSAPAVKQPVEDVCIDASAGGACAHWAMDGYYAALAASQKNKATTRVSWYGDSVSATDLIPGRVRDRLQAAYGDGGPGFVHAAQPHRFMDSHAFTRTNTGHWMTWSSSLVQIPDNLYGFGGSTAEAIGPGNKVRVKVKTPSGKLSRIDVYYLAQPRGGSAEILVDGAAVATFDTAADAKKAQFQTAAVADGEHVVEVQVVSGRVRLFGLAVERDQGLVVDNVALVSASAKTMLNNLPEHWTSQLAHRDPDLVVVMLGSNESIWLSAGRRAMNDYQALFGRMLAPIRAARPGASCLVVAPLDQAEDKDGTLVSRALIPVMVEAQRQAAREHGCAFWDAFSWMGGRGAAVRWNHRGLLGSDFHHLSPKGSTMLADGLVGALEAGYLAYKTR